MRCPRSSTGSWQNRASVPAWLTVALLTSTACGKEPPAATGAGGRPPSGIAGVLQDEAGRPIADANVMACMSTVCLYSKSAADGRFGFDVEPPADIAIKTDGDPSATPRRAAALYPVRLTEARVMDVGVVRSPSLPDGVPLAAAAKDPQTIQAGDGLTLILNRGALTPRLGEVLIDVAARQVPAALLPRYTGLGNDQVLAVYALHPFAAKSTVPIQVKARTPLPDGTVVRFRTISEIDGQFSPPVSGRAAGGWVSTDAGAGISELTYLVIAR